MTDIVDRLNPGELIQFIAVAIPFVVLAVILLISLTAIISRCVYKIRRDATAAQLKQDMLDRGMSAEEIKTVLEAGPKT